jgi:molybdopterin-guanine dinucleotide biosynthesis protein A
MASMNLTGAVLAGGKSSRMGRDKAALVVGGETFLARQLRLLAKIGVAERLVITAPWSGPSEAPYRDLPVEVRQIQDRIPDAGPLAGLEAALSAATADLVLVLAVDLPAMSAEFLRRLQALATPGCGVVPLHDGVAEPLVAIYPRQARAEITARLASRELALQPFVRAGLAAGWLRELPVESAGLHLFANWNRPEDITTRQR